MRVARVFGRRRSAPTSASSGPSHPPFRRWVAFDPPLRDPRVAPTARREVWCRACGASFGHTDDPVDALLVAWRQRRHMVGAGLRRVLS